MKILKIFIICLILLPFALPEVSYTKAYEASSLLNSAKRSQSISDLYLDSINTTRRYGRQIGLTLAGSYIPGLTVYTDYGPKDVTLFRVFSSAIGIYPVHLKGDFYMPVGVGVGGYRYGLSKKVDLNNYKKDGSSITTGTTLDNKVANKYDVSDFVFDQFYDDIFGVSFGFSKMKEVEKGRFLPKREYLFVNAGIILNEAYRPDKGKMKANPFDKDSSTRIYSKSRFFSDITFYNCISANVQIGASGEDADISSVGLSFRVMEGIQNFQGTENPTPPNLQKSRITEAPKKSGLEALKFNLIYAAHNEYKGDEIKHPYTLGKGFSVYGFELAYPGIGGILNLSSRNEFYGKKYADIVGLNVVRSSSLEALCLVADFRNAGDMLVGGGGTYFADPMLKQYNDSGEAWGGFAEVVLEFPKYGTAKFKYQYNNSNELLRFIEAYDKHMFLFSLEFGF